jgi:hypothetical protein
MLADDSTQVSTLIPAGLLPAETPPDLYLTKIPVPRRTRLKRQRHAILVGPIDEIQTAPCYFGALHDRGAGRPGPAAAA